MSVHLCMLPWLAVMIMAHSYRKSPDEDAPCFHGHSPTEFQGLSHALLISEIILVSNSLVVAFKLELPLRELPCAPGPSKPNKTPDYLEKLL